MPKSKAKIITGKTPAQLGFTFPAEWAPHSGTWFSWPRPEGISFPEHYEEIPANFAAIFREITPRELVHINVPNVNYEKIVTAFRRRLEEFCHRRGIIYLLTTPDIAPETLLMDTLRSRGVLR